MGKSTSDKKPTGGAPIGTHSLTGGAVNVGIPSPAPEAKERGDQKAERSKPRDAPPGAEEPDPFAEPRANTGEILGPKR